MKYSAIPTAIGLAAILTLAQVFIRNASTQAAQHSLLSINAMAWLIPALTLYFAVFVVYTFALQQLSISFLFPVYTGLCVIFVFIAGVTLFQEPVTAKGIAGCLIIVLGVWLMSSMGQSPSK